MSETMARASARVYDDAIVVACGSLGFLVQLSKSEEVTIGVGSLARQIPDRN